MTNIELLINFKRLNKVAREKRAHRLGYQSAADYIKYLNGELIAVGVPINTTAAKPKPAHKPKATTKAIPTIHIVDVLDSSGSMEGPKNKAAMQGINEGLNELRKEESVIYKYTLCDFSNNILFPYVDVDPKRVPTIKIGTRGSTALYDAIGSTIKRVDHNVGKNDKVLVNIYTDGQENASREYSARQISNMIEEYAHKGWTVTFIGTKQDVEFAHRYLNVDMSNTRSYDGTAKGLQESLADTKAARHAYTRGVVAGADVSTGFYKNLK